MPKRRHLEALLLTPENVDDAKLSAEYEDGVLNARQL
jgi:hypothetical protein